MQKSRLNVGKQQDNRPKRDRKDNQRHGDNRNQRPQEAEMNSEIKVLSVRNNRPDQRRGEQAQWHQKLISKRVQQH